MNKDTIARIEKYAALLKDKISNGPTEKHKNRPKSYMEYLKADLAYTLRVLEELKVKS